METKATTGAAFAINIAEWCKATNKNVEQAARAIVFEIYGRVIRRTPVDTGAARGNWQVGYNQMPQGKVSGGAGLGALGGKPIVGNIIFLVNNLPYIGVLEYGGYPNPPKTGFKTVGGFSKQAPAGMVRVTVQELSDIVQTAINSKGGSP